jgi:transposase
MGQQVYVGVDWGEAKHVYSVRTADGRQRRGTFGATAEAVHEWVRTMRAEHPEATIVVAVEQSRGALTYALRPYDFIELVPVNPRAAKAYRDALYLSGAKDDPIDAELLREFVMAHRDRLRSWRADDAHTRKLGLLVEGRRKLVDQRTSATQALTATLKQYFPQVLAWFGDPASRLARAFIRQWPTLQSVGSARAPQLIRVIKAHSRKKDDAIDQLLAAIRSAVPLTNDEAIIEPMSRLALAYVGVLDALEPSIRDHDERIAQLTAMHADAAIFSSFPGAGAVMTPRLIAAFGTDRNRWESAADVQRYSGIAPVIERSGNRTSTHARIHFPKFMRQTFHEFAQASMPHSAWAQAFYMLQRDRGAGHHQAIRALAFRWIRILYHCWSNRVVYDEQVHTASLRRHGSPCLAHIAA